MRSINFSILNCYNYKRYIIVFILASSNLFLSFNIKNLYGCTRCESFDYLCCDIPGDSLFLLTSFSGEGMACGGYADGNWYYSTSWVRWYCDAKLSVTNPENGKCVVVQVADAGPAAWVEELAGMPIIDASPLVCNDLFNSNSCGWSDRFVVEVHQVPDETPTGSEGCQTPQPEPETEPELDNTETSPVEYINENNNIQESDFIVELQEPTGEDNTVSIDGGMEIEYAEGEIKSDGNLWVEEMNLEGGCGCWIN